MLAVKKLMPTDIDTPMLGFGPYPLYPTLCQPDKAGIATDNYPYGICTLKIISEPGTPTFYTDTAAGIPDRADICLSDQQFSTATTSE